MRFDGGSRGNPGHAGVGVVLAAADGTPLVTLGRYIGTATNNVAEYMALIVALGEAAKLGAENLHVRGDSELIIKQMRGEYRVKNPGLKELYEKAQSLVRQFAQVRFEHNLREHNTLADRLANRAMDRKADVTEIDDAPAAGEDVGRSGRLRCPGCGCQIEVVTQPPVSKVSGSFVCRCGTPMS